MSAVLALVLSLVMSPEAARARQGPMLFGSGQATFLVLGPAGPGDTLRMARVRVTHAELPESRSFDDAEYHLAVETPPNSRPGQVLTGTLWRFGAESPDGRKLSDGVRVEILREDRIAPLMSRGWESPTITASRGPAPVRRSASRKMSGCGFQLPTSPLTSMWGNQRSRPIASIL